MNAPEEPGFLDALATAVFVTHSDIVVILIKVLFAVLDNKFALTASDIILF